MNYTIHQLQVFLKVVEYESITKASEQLFMTQPAVSIQLKNFQEQFEIKLTEVIGRKLYITEFGKEVAEIAKRVMAELDSINYMSESFKGLLTGRLSISSASTGKYVIPYFLSGFLERHSGIELLLDVTNKSKVIESLMNNEIDFAIVSVLPENLNIEEEILIDNKLFLVSNEKKPSSSKPLIYREEGSATRKVMEDYFDQNQVNRHKQMELTSNEAVKQAVIAGIGNSVMPLIGMHTEINNGELHILSSKGLPIITQWRMVWLKGKKLSPISTALLEYIRVEKLNILKKHFGWYEQY
ncbi:LysR family transcriptional regulator [Jiulongibacter sp. NS-SX5]|uniref:LysR family transcriptional regulator n=1 Tax=Jiulongibacter sp. NS-SX5 TaxID=3463854 RepID=UPI0040595D4D